MPPQMKTTSILALTMLACVITQTATAALVRSDNFDTQTPGVLPTGTGSAWNTPGSGVIDNNTDLFTRVETDSSNLFGKGTSNQYLRISDTSNSNSTSTYNLRTQTSSMGQSGTVTFNFYDPSGDSAQGDGWLLRLGTFDGNSNTAFGLFLMNGQLRIATGTGVSASPSAFASYSLDTLNSLTIFFNTSASSITYAGHTLAADTIDVWLNGSIVGSGLARSGGLSGVQSLQNVNFTSKTSATSSADFVGTLFIDSFSAYSGIEISSIPEPSTFSILGGSFALMAAVGCRRRRLQR